jgi:hypothetical protein
MTFPDTPTGATARSRRGWYIAGGAALAIVIAAGAAALVMLNSARADSSATAATSPTSAVASIAPTEPEPSHVRVVADPAALDACEMVNKAQGDDLYDPTKMRAVGQRAAQSFNTAVKQKGGLLIERVDAAIAAKGDDATFQAKLAMQTAAQDLEIYCVQQKFVTTS